MDYSRQNRFKINSLLLVREYGVILLIMLFVVIFTIVNPRFLSISNLSSLARQVTPIAMVTLGTMFVLLSGNIDLTVGMGVGLGSVIVGAVLYITQNIGLALTIMFLGVIILGFVNGFLVSKFKLGSVIATLIVMTILQGLIYYISTEKALLVSDYSLFRYLGRVKILGIPSVFILLIFVLLIGYFILNFTKAGFYTLAIGNNEEGARLAGINVDKWKFFPFIASGICMGLGALTIIPRTMRIVPEIGGTSLLLDAIAAAIIGGISIHGGKGNISSVVIGAFTVAIINNAIFMMPIHPAWNEFFKGAIIILVVLFNRFIVNVKVLKAY